MDDILSEHSTMTHPSWVALHGMAHSFIELDKAVVHVIKWLVLCDCGFQSVSLLDYGSFLIGDTDLGGNSSDGWGHVQ